MNPTTITTTLTQSQKAQAAILYHFSSLDYLKGLHRMVSGLMDGTVDPLLTLSKDQNRDSVLVNPRWGSRNTTENWSNNAWPFLRDFQLSLAKDIAGRSFEKYGITDTNNCFRGMSEYSMQWATAEEEERFKELIEEIGDYACRIDQTLDDYRNSRWSDFSFVRVYRNFAAAYPTIPKFRVRRDVIGETGRTPVRTGVYVAQDDPYAALQFAWTGGGGGKLRPAKTFNDIGLAALKEVGRKDLWLDDQKMFDFAMRSPQVALFKPTIYMLGTEHRDFAAGAVAREAFADQPCKWYFVEMINGEFEDIFGEENISPAQTVEERIVGGEKCLKRGFYFTPAGPNSRRHFSEGEPTPQFDSQYGQTIWQWDPRQD